MRPSLSMILCSGLLAAASAAHAELISLVPNAYAAGTNLANASPGVTLAAWSAGGPSVTTLGQLPGSFDFSSNVLTTPASACQCDTAFGGQNVLGPYTGVLGLWSYSEFAHLYPNSGNVTSWDLLEASFATPTNLVQVIAGGLGTGDMPALMAFDSGGNAIAQCGTKSANVNCVMIPITTSFGGAGNAYDLLVNVPTYDITSVAVGGWDGGAYVQSLTYNAPEPGILALLGVGFAGLLLVARRKPSSALGRR